MPIQPGTYAFGPGNGTLSVKTGRTGAAAKAGHNLLIYVTEWQGTLEIAADPAHNSIVLEVDSTSLRVREGSGGMQELGGDDMVAIEATIDDEILKREDITFRSTEVQVSGDGSRLDVKGELTLVGHAAPLALEVTVNDDGRLASSVVVKQSDWGLEPYSTLFGTLKVVDEVEVALDAALEGGDVGAVAATPEWDRPEDVGSRIMGLRVPTVDPRVSSFGWALITFLLLWFDLVAVGVSQATAIIFALVASSFVFLFVLGRR